MARANTAKAKTAATNLPVPQSDAEAEQLIAQYGAAKRDQAEAELHHKASVAALSDAHGKVIAEMKDREQRIYAALEIWASAHRNRLTNEGRRKTVRFASGDISWAEGRTSIDYRPLKAEDVVAIIQGRIAELNVAIDDAKARRKPREAAELTAKLRICEGFLRTKLEPNKQAMSAAPDVAETLRGITVSRGQESFNVKPLAGQISEVA